MCSDVLARLEDSVVRGDVASAASLVREGLQAGLSPLLLVNEGLVKGIRRVGDLFGSGEYFLPDLMIGARAMEAGIAILEPALAARDEVLETAGVVVIGTVEGDLHDLGKNIVVTMLKSAGFQVHDLGVNVSATRFLEKVLQTEADILGMSALLTTTIGKQREVIELLEEKGIRDHVRIMVGGAPITAQWARDIGADSYGADAIEAAREALRLVGKS